VFFKLCRYAPDDPISKECGSRFHQRGLQMLPSMQLKEVLACQVLLPEPIAFLKKGNLHIFSDINPGINE
jgi:hypothetical protein